MDDFIKRLDPHFDYVSHDFVGDRIHIIVRSNQRNACCPYCNTSSFNVHSVYEKSFQDLPIQGQKVIIHLQNRKFFCGNSNCDHHTFAERFDCIDYKSKKTKRLEQEVLTISLHCSSVTAAKILRNGIVDIGKSTICKLLNREYPRPHR